MSTKYPSAHPLAKLLLLFALSTTASAQDEPDLDGSNWPVTVEAAAADILASMSAEDKVAIRQTKKDDLIQYHHGWGTGIRNHYGLRRGNTKLIESACRKGCDPDHASMVIIEAVWSSLQLKS